MLKRFWNWLTVDRHIYPTEATLVEFDKKKSYILSIPDCSPEELRKLKEMWNKEMKKKKPTTLFINKEVKLEEIKNGSKK